MFKVMKQMVQGYPEKYKARIETLKTLGEQELQSFIEKFLTEPQNIIGFSGKTTISDAIQQAQREDLNFLEVEAPFLTFPRATPNKWNGNIDSIDTITGTYNIFTGEDHEIHNLRLNKKYKGGPQLIPTLQKMISSEIRVTMRVDPMICPSSRIILIF